ncbi:MAG: thiolase family protein [Myxococcales bacterium]|nr:thiolase family protein [Myxococcales bacterium]
MEIFIVGAASTAFRKWPERDFRSLTAEVFDAALADAGLADGGAVEQVVFGNCAMGSFGQGNIRGQVCLGPQVHDGRLAAHTPIINVEAGCATGGLALHQAIGAVRGGAGLAMALGVEKVFVPDDPEKSFAVFAGGIDQLHPEEWQKRFAAVGEETALGWHPHPGRIVFLDVHALQARWHMQTHGTTVEQIAQVAAKNHAHGVHNPKAQFRKAWSVDAVLADRLIVPPLSRPMCAPISDGAAAVLVCSKRWLNKQPAEVQARAVRIRACALAGGRDRAIDAPSVVQICGQRAYAQARLKPADVAVAEVHDATAFCELTHYEALGFCGPGEGGAYMESGATRQGGARPVNLSGGLLSKGHPLGATGLGQIDELVAQLRGEAGDRQAAGEPRIGLAQNAGGMVGFDEALCAVTLLERAA